MTWKQGTCKCGARVQTRTGLRAQCTECRTAEILAQPEEDFEPAFSPLWPSMYRGGYRTATLKGGA